MIQAHLPLDHLQTAVHHALKLWHAADDAGNPLEALQLCQQRDSSPRQAANEALFAALTELEITYPTEAQILRLHFLENMKMHAVANRLNLAESTVQRRQRYALEHLTTIIAERESQLQTDLEIALDLKLDLPPKTQLVGVETLLAEVVAAVQAPVTPWLIAIEGLGGLGKTALAAAAVRRLAHQPPFAEIAWVSAKQTEFLPGLTPTAAQQPALDADTLITMLLPQLVPDISLTLSAMERQAALMQALKQRACLVVIDNLETVADYQGLLPVLRKLVNPSKILLTSRHSLQTHPEVACFRVQALSQADALDLLTAEATLRRVDPVLDASPAQLADIYDVVGGNPLALKLVVGQLSSLPLSQVLENLRQARGQTVETLYTYIYWQAWHLLDEAGQQLLLAMPLAQRGTLKHIAATSGLDFRALSEAIARLIRLSLVEVSGSVDQRRYRIHWLTETFLLNEVVKWQQP